MPKRLTKEDADLFVKTARVRDLGVVRNYLELGISPDVLDKDGMNALFAATGYRDIPLPDQMPLLTTLLTAGANPNLLVKHKANDGSTHLTTPLHRATKAWNGPVIDLLLDHGADPRVLDGAGQTAAHTLVFTRFGAGMREDQTFLLTCLQRMIDLGVPINQVDGSRQTILGLAVENDVSIDVLSWLLDTGASPYGVMGCGQSAFQVAADNNNLDAIRFFSDRGARINHTDEQGRTAMFTYSLNDEVGQCLLDLGADLEHRDAHGRTPMCHALVDQTPVGVSPGVAFLIRAGADLDAADFQRQTPRSIIKSRKMKDVQRLIDASTARRAIRHVATSGLQARAPSPKG